MIFQRGFAEFFLSVSARAILFALILWQGWGFIEGSQKNQQERVNFNREILPILADNCFTCHGPDVQQRQGNLRLDVPEGVFADRSNYKIISPGDFSNSRLYQRISAEQDTLRMPPPWAQTQLTDSQIELVRRWIEQGAKWQRHWSFVSPQSPISSKSDDADWDQTPIDFFVLEELKQRGMEFSPRADRTTLIRRVSLDLTGLPPTTEEVDAFLADTTTRAYERVVDRLLASPRYGERMAWDWLEAARYADSNGYQTDGEREMWRWRDWVIDAINQNMPFDQFTVEQIAGDMLPDSTLSQKIATGFNRNHRGNGEGGIIPEEYLVEYVVDRVDTTSTVWLGLTVGCARCHDHKYDPISQREFYQLFSYFNNVPESGSARKEGNSPPMIKTPTVEQRIELEELERKLSEAEAQFRKSGPKLAMAQAEWERMERAEHLMDWSIDKELLAHYPLDGSVSNTAKTDDNSEEQESKQSRFKDGVATFVPGRIGQGASFEGKRFIEAGNVGDFNYRDRFSLAAWVYPQGQPNGAILSRVENTAEAQGYSFYLKDGKLRLNLGQRWLDDAVRVETVKNLSPGRWQHVMATYDGSMLSTGVKVYINGEPAEFTVLLDDMNVDFKTKEPLRIGSLGGSQGRFQGYIDDVRIYSNVLSSEDMRIIATSDLITDILALSTSQRDELQTGKINRFFLEQHSPEWIRRQWHDLVTLRVKKRQFQQSIPTTMVMMEMDTPRETFLLIRGAYDKPGEKVTGGIPAIFPPLPAGEKNNRLGFSRWLISPSNPLTARVVVNRYWQNFFSRGLVPTTENFGSQGEPPSHPRLLDWLAIEFMKNAWNVKALQKKIVMSATYCQSSKITSALLERDPDNRWLGRAPRLRLSAATIRDQALAASGLLVEKVGGPSVRPYQPIGLWKELAGGDDYVTDSGENLYRRSLYTFWKRTIPPPSMAIFDAPNRDMCVVRQTRTNTPLQALNLMNDVTYVEASRALAERIIVEGGDTPEQRITLAMRLVIGRFPKVEELKVLLGNLEYYLRKYGDSESEALEFISVGESSYSEVFDAREIAAYTAVSSLILNLDETVTRE